MAWSLSCVSCLPLFCPRDQIFGGHPRGDSRRSEYLRRKRSSAWDLSFEYLLCRPISSHFRTVYQSLAPRSTRLSLGRARSKSSHGSNGRDSLHLGGCL